MAGKRWPLKSRMVDALLCLCFYVGCIVSMWMGKSEWWGCHSTGRILRREGMVWVVGEILMGKCLCSGNAFGGIEFEKLLKQVESYIAIRDTSPNNEIRMRFIPSGDALGNTVDNGTFGYRGRGFVESSGYKKDKYLTTRGRLSKASLYPSSFLPIAPQTVFQLYA